MSVVDTSNMSIAKQRKYKYAASLKKALSTYSRILVINVDNVGSNQLQRLRKELRGRAQILMGKNTVIRKILREHERPEIQELLPCIDGNIGFVFTDDDLGDLKDIITHEKLPAAAKVGMTAPCKVVLKSGSTGLDPGQTSFFQAMNIATRITRGAIEICEPYLLCEEGDKVTSTAVALMSKMEMKPFFFGIVAKWCYDNGEIFSARVLDLSTDDLVQLFLNGVANVAAVSLEINYPTACSVPHSVVNAFRNLLFVSLATDFEFAESKQYKDLLNDPEALAAAQAAAAPKADAVEEKAESSSEEESSDPSSDGLFD